MNLLRGLNKCLTQLRLEVRSMFVKLLFLKRFNCKTFLKFSYFNFVPVMLD